MTASSGIAPDAVRAPQFHDVDQRRRASELGMWVFLASEIMFFGALFVGYAVSRFDDSAAFAAASRHTDIVLGTLNTALLLTSSYTIALALFTLRAGSRRAALALLLTTAVLGTAFLAIKGLEYRQDYIEGLVPWLDFRFDPTAARGAALFFYLYFVMTGVHAVHVTIGIALVLVMAARVHSCSLSARYSSPLEVSALYWHLVDVVWIFLYPALYLVGRAGGTT
jgi:cytochrome c oxidase subunit 3